MNINIFNPFKSREPFALSCVRRMRWSWYWCVSALAERTINFFGRLRVKVQQNGMHIEYLKRVSFVFITFFQVVQNMPSYFFGTERKYCLRKFNERGQTDNKPFSLSFGQNSDLAWGRWWRAHISLFNIHRNCCRCVCSYFCMTFTMMYITWIATAAYASHLQ